MDVALLSKMISQLILDRDEVALPGVGTFVAEVMPASFSDRGYTINPPYRRLSFYTWNSEDRSLVELYAKSNGISIERAESYLSGFLADLKATLKERKTVVFPGLGRMRATKDDVFFFVGNEDLDIFPDGLGLEPVSLKNNGSFQEEPQPLVSHSVVGNRFESSGDDEVQTDVPADNPQKDEAVPEKAEPQAAEVQPESLETESQSESEGKASAQSHKLLWVILAVIAVAAVALVVFLILAKVAPDFIDSILYTPEELEILRW